ncbi:MAG TPA: DUF2232 domain-containing protein [Candidatus Hydrogenedens sp.]|nr:DUF2232 domain-containing protein [Candidatus Hydrogenedens sp.]
MSNVLTKILFLILITAYLTGEGVFILLPLVTVVAIGLTTARNSWFRTALLCLSLIPGFALGAFMESLPLTTENLLMWTATFLAGILLPVSVGSALRKYSWSRCLLLVTAFLFISGTALTMYFWNDLRKDITISINARIAEINNLSKEQEISNSEEINKNFIEGLKYLDYHWEDFHIGLLFGQSLITALIIMGWMIARLKIMPTEDGIHYWENPQLGSFSHVRPPDYLVWLAILTAIILIYDQHYNVGEWLRIVSRNTAVILSFIYWLNGLSILTFCAILFHWNIILTLVIVLFVFGVWTFPILALFGFFDTWWEFRLSLLRLYNRLYPATNS